MLRYICILVVLGGADTVHAKAQIPTESLVGYWSLDEGVGFKLKDRSPTQNDAEFFGPIWAAGRFGRGIKFEGSKNERIVVPYHVVINPNHAITLSVWVYPTAFHPKENRTLMLPGAYNLDMFGGVVRVAILAQEGAHGINSPQKLPPNQWHHLAASYSRGSGKLSLFIDGKRIASKKQQHSGIPKVGSPLVVGGTKTHNALIGTVDEVRIYNRALNASEIRALYEAGSSPPPTTP